MKNTDFKAIIENMGAASCGMEEYKNDEDGRTQAGTGVG